MYWARGEQDTAKHTMKQVTDKLAKVYTRSRSLTRLYAHALGIHGNWLAETHSESPNTIMSIYLEKAVNLYEAVEDSSQEAMEAYLALARFADLQYQTIVNYMKSPTFESKQALMRKTSAELTKIERMKGRSKYTLILAKQQQIDEQEMENLKLDKNTFLDTAIDNYMRCLEIGDFHDMRVFRLISLWFENDSDDEVNKKLQTGLPRIQSRKFLPLMYQLAARMTTRQHDDDSFHPTLNQLIERTTLDHPHHTLFVILALSNANKDDVMLNPKPKKSSKLATTKSTSSSTNEDRMQAAKNMLGRLQNQRGVIITAMERLCDAYIQLAYFNVDQYKKETRPINLPSELKLPKLKDLKHVAMPTTEIPVDPQCCYDNIVYIKGFEPTFRLAGGINLPKIITCIASDGTKKKQLVKGRDDLRQDAVMQQMFGLVNKLLQKDPETRKRKLTVRRYKVIPLSQRSGILEWCEGTIPLGEYLIGNQRTNEGAHQRYNPRQLSPWDCRRRMNAAHDKGQVTDKNQTYRNVCDRFHPVFRHFFLENFQDPAVWFERRLAYTRSVATSSIVGYVVGLGDRHVQNILIDCNTAELVHIDLGVAFEQGRILPTPETVPFRLTRDIVDGMGVAEVEGVFRRCCEKTMEVMHNNQEALLTIVEVLLYDPLYVWTLSPIKAIQLQQTKADPDVSELNITTAGERDLLDGAGDSNETNTEESNKMAERVLLRLQQKLKGVEEGVVVSVSGQINRLIQEARDPKNLCKLFPGWQSWI
ncbi:serine-protein kinase ATM-like [Glandiceps talaboti]